jgi:peptide/nickel transport system substrate-binding protein
MSVTVWIPKWIHFGANAGGYVASVLQSLGFDAHFRITAEPYNDEDKLRLQAGFYGWGSDFATAAGFIEPTLTCKAYNPMNARNTNTAEFCDRSVDRQIARAQSLQTSAPQTSSRLWANIDRAITDQAPWVPFANGVKLELRSTRVGNYQYNPQWGTLLDQLWVK